MSSDAGARLDGAEPAIEMVGLGKRYEIYDRPHHRLLQTMLRGRRNFCREFWALADVTLSVNRGETVGVIGRNGSGKSTLLQLVAGTLTPTTGMVRTRGRIAALLELGSGFNPEFTGRENVYLNGAILGVARREMEEAFPAIEAFAGIGEFIDQPVKIYSSGMVVRLAFSVAVHVTPEILIVDEALAVGDTAFQSKCLDRIRRIQESGVAILLVSHAANTVIEFCDRAAYLDAGRLIAVGSCREIVERYTNDIVSSYGGTPLAPASPGVRSDPEMPVAASLEARENAPRPATEIVNVSLLDEGGRDKVVFGYGERVRVRVEVVFHEPNQAPCFGIQLKSIDDIALWACTTRAMGLKPAAGEAGKRGVFEWLLSTHLGGARYVVALGCGSVATGEYIPHSRMHYAAHFDVLPRPRHGTGWLEPSAIFVDAGISGSAALAPSWPLAPPTVGRRESGNALPSETAR